MMDIQCIGDNLYDIVYVLCEDARIGFKILPAGAGGFSFQLYSGQDRSYSQNINPPVVFSSQFENLLESNYIILIKLRSKEVRLHLEKSIHKPYKVYESGHLRCEILKQTGLDICRQHFEKAV